MPGVLIIIENLPMPNDRRAWLQATTLQKAGYEVSVISIKGKNAQKSYECIDDVHVYRYPAPPPTSGTLSFIIEFAYCWIMSFFYSIYIAFRRGFKIIHAANPPETFWLIGLLYKPFGKKFLFDHRDLSPEMYYSRFNKQGTAYKALLFLERMTFRTIDVALTTNETQKQIALERDNCPEDKIFIVRNGPDHRVLYPVAPKPELKQGFPYMVSYLGVINPQDGVDTLIHVAQHVVHQLGRTDILFNIMGDGDALDDLEKLAAQLAVAQYIHFAGWVEQDTIRNYLSSSDVAVDTMPKTPYSDAATLNKILEYMAVGCPTVCFDMVETRVSAGEAAVYAEPDNIPDLSRKIVNLLDNEAQREKMSQLGRDIIEKELAWEHQSKNLLAAYQRLMPMPQHPEPSIN